MLALIGRYSLPFFATGCVLVAIGEVIVETRPGGFNHPVTLGGFIVAGGILVHYSSLAFWRRGAPLGSP